VTWAYQMMAIIPFLRGFAHLDIFRSQRSMQYSRIAFALGLSPIISLIVAAILSFYMNDYRIMLWSIIAQQFAYTVLTHVFAQRPYRLAWDTSVISRAFSFGVPLLASNVLMFVNFQGDKLLVGNQLGSESLGWYSAVFLLIATPCLTIASTYQSLTLPNLSKLQSDAKSFLDRAHCVFEGACFGAAGFLIGIVLFGPALFIALFGFDYKAALPLLAICGVAQMLRLARVGVYIGFLAKAITKPILLVSLVRSLALPAGFFALSAGYGIQGMILCNIAGEAVALLVAASIAVKKKILLFEKIVVVKPR